MSNMDKAETSNNSTQTFNDIDEESRLDLLTLGNMFLHASYWYLALSVNAKALSLPGFAWALIENEKKCRDAANLIMTFVKDHGGILEFADVARPKYDDSEISPEYICKRWDDIEDWLSNKIAQASNEYKAKPLEDLALEGLMNDLVSLVKIQRWDRKDDK